MPPRRLGKTAPQKHELEAFAEKYDTLACIYGDPVEAVFGIMAKNLKPHLDPATGLFDFGDDEIALRAAEMLMNYRYPRVKSSEGAAPKAQVLNFNVRMDAPATPELPVNAPPARLPSPVRVVEAEVTSD
jgi:hypothetical protein